MLERTSDIPTPNRFPAGAISQCHMPNDGDSFTPSKTPRSNPRSAKTYFVIPLSDPGPSTNTEDPLDPEFISTDLKDCLSRKPQVEDTVTVKHPPCCAAASVSNSPKERTTCSGSEVPVVGTRHDDAGVLVRDHGPVRRVLALDIAAGLRQLGDLVAAPVVDE